MMIGIPSPQDGGGEAVMMRRVGEDLAFEAEAPAFVVGRAVLSGRASGEVVAGVELDGGQGRQDLQFNAAFGAVGFRGSTKGAVRACENPVMVIASRHGELLKGGVGVRTGASSPVGMDPASVGV